MKQTPQNVSPFSNKARNAYVIEHITDSFLKLLRDKPIGDISINELCNKGGKAGFRKAIDMVVGISYAMKTE